MSISDNHLTKVTGCYSNVTLPDVGSFLMPPNARHAHELARATLRVWVPAVAVQPIGPTLP